LFLKLEKNKNDSKLIAYGDINARDSRINQILTNQFINTLTTFKP